MCFSAYLVGSFERRFGVGSSFQIINPTTEDLEVVVAFFDDQEKYQTCLKNRLTPNDMWEIVVPVHVKDLKPQFGVVKIISYRDKTPKEGLVGYQRHVLVTPKATEVAFSETVLAAVPTGFAGPELAKLLELCKM
ncbi:MAG: hypothetical protein WHT07_08855 [Desulfobaccales bacterium]